jgi:serine/threonine protein kinase
MKKSAVPAKRLARARIIELNGPAERVELLLLIFMAPLWGIVFPLIGINTLASYAGIILLGASFFCFLHFLHLNNSRFSFEETGVRLPGVDHRVHHYSSLKRIYLDNQSPLLLAIEFLPQQSWFSSSDKPEQPVVQLFEIQHLTEESARQMWALFASHLRSCTISLDVRDKLVNWRTQSSKLEQNKLLLEDSAHPNAGSQAQLGFASDRSSGHNSQIARDLSMVVELKPFDPLKVVGQYMVSYSDTFRKTWLTCWMVVAGVAYPVSIATMLVSKVADSQVQSVGPAIQTTQTSVGDWFSQTGTQLTTLSTDSLATIFGNNIGAIGLFVLLYLAIYKFMRHLNDPDSMYVDYMGITTQKRTTAGVQPKEHRGWKSIDEIKLVRPHERSNSSRWSIDFECNQEKEKISVPFKAFSSDRVRQQFIECLDTWGRNLKIDPNLLEALAPRNQTSYTELWLSALSEAPKIDELTPHSIGLRLQSRAYEIERQLASGGQGVAYLARKLKTMLPPIGELDKSPATSLAASLGQNPAAGPAESSSESSSESPSEKLVENPSQSVEEIPDDTANAQKVEATAQIPDFEHVVLKETVLPIYVDDRARAKALGRFERDAKLLASLKHPLIVRLDDFFVENNRAYLALEYIPGLTLKEKIEADGPLEEGEVKRLALMMADILEYLHERTPPVEHRDFTPDNLILTNDGKVKLIDFDVALEQSSFSQTNATIVGKQAYIPLEQFRGKPCPQSDLYALGATLSYLLTGEEPPALQSSSPKQLKPEVSEEFDQIIARATALEISERIDCAKSLRKLLLGAAPEINNTGADSGAGNPVKVGADPAVAAVKLPALIVSENIDDKLNEKLNERLDEKNGDKKDKNQTEIKLLVADNLDTPQTDAKVVVAADDTKESQDPQDTAQTLTDSTLTAAEGGG